MSSDHLGHRLRAVRLARNYTLADVAKLTGLSKSFISMLENGKTNISAKRLQRLAGIYDLTVDDFLPSERSRSLIQIVRHDDRARLNGFAEGVDAMLLVRDMHRRIQPVWLRLEVGTHHANDRGHAGEEFVMVLHGRIGLSVDGGAFERLGEGDAAFYPSALSHVYRNDGDDVAELLTISAPNTWFHS